MSAASLEIWPRLLEEARKEIPDQVFKTWLEPTTVLSLSEETLYIGVPDQFAADWNNAKHSELLSNLTALIVGSPLRIVFKVNEEQQKRLQMDLFIPQPTDHHIEANLESSLSLNNKYTFSNFIIGKSNELASATAQAVAEAPGRVYNPLFIYGNTGLGKTHLMQAIAHHIQRHKSGVRLTITTTEEFTNQLITAIQRRTTPEFRRQFRQTDLLLIDDIHFLRKTEATQEEFFHTFNALYEAGRQIVLTSDRPPSEIPGLEQRLVTRFQWGMVADIQPPDLEHRIAILQHKASLERLEETIPQEVIHFIAENTRSSIRELEGTIIKILAYSSLKNRTVTIELAREVIRDKHTQDETASSYTARALTITNIQEAVALEWGITIDAIKSKTRTRALTLPRHVSMYLIRQILGTQLVEIGKAFGARDHSTVIHGLERITTMLQNDSTLRDRMHKIEKALASITHKT